MTFIHPQRHALVINLLLIFLILAVAVAAFWIIILYNRFVNTTHAVTELSDQLQSMKAKDAELKDSILKLFNANQLDSLAASRGLVKEKKPQYLEVQQTWVLASH